MKDRHWRVTVAVGGNEVVAIEPEMLAGVPNIDDYADEVRTAAQHLLAFIGPKNPEPFFLGDDLPAPSDQEKRS